MRIFLVVKSSFQRLLENCNDVGSIGSGNEFKGALDLLKELVASVDGLLLQVHLVCNANARDVRALIPHLSVPVAQIRVSNFASDIEDHDADVGTEVIGRVQLVEGLLTSRVPNVLTKEIRQLENDLSFAYRLFLWSIVGT